MAGHRIRPCTGAAQTLRDRGLPSAADPLSSDQMDARSGRFPLVDSLRATAALAILTFHLFGYAGALTVPVVSEVVLRLPVGVTLFFLISGFLLYRPFVAARMAGQGLPHVGAYAWRRFLRIVPAYWAALTVVALLIKPEVFDRPLRFYGFLQVYDPSQALGGLAVAWSLCVEVTFYAMLPLYALAIRGLPAGTAGRRWRAEVAGLALLTAATLGFRIWVAEGGPMSSETRGSRCRHSSTGSRSEWASPSSASGSGSGRRRRERFSGSNADRGWRGSPPPSPSDSRRWPPRG